MDNVHYMYIPSPPLSVQPLVSLSSSLMSQLESRMAAWDERVTLIGDIFMHMVSGRHGLSNREYNCLQVFMSLWIEARQWESYS